MSKLLLLSNSTMPGTPFFTWPRPWVGDFLGNTRKKLVFIPFAAVTFSFDEYEAKVKEVLNHEVISIHRIDNKIEAIRNAEGIVVGGGNTFALLSRIYQFGLRDAIREKVTTGSPYIGWSAGANLACPTLMTTNDMPIVQPPSFEALNLVPFQINPHYHELKFENQGGETRIERLNEFLAMNPPRKVVGLPEGMLILVNGNIATVEGTGIARVYRSGADILNVNAGTDVSFLFQ